MFVHSTSLMSSSNVFVLNHQLYLQYQVSGNLQNCSGIVSFSHFWIQEKKGERIKSASPASEYRLFTIEKFDNVSKIHIVLQNNVTIIFDQCQGYEQNEIGRRNMFGTPNGLPNAENIFVQQFCKQTKE